MTSGLVPTLLVELHLENTSTLVHNLAQSWVPRKHGSVTSIPQQLLASPALPREGSQTAGLWPHKGWLKQQTNGPACPRKCCPRDSTSELAEYVRVEVSSIAWFPPPVLKTIGRLVMFKKSCIALDASLWRIYAAECICRTPATSQKSFQSWPTQLDVLNLSA